MKPTLPANDEASRSNLGARRFPVTDYHFQSMEMGAYNAHCADANTNSFRVCREYFDNEAARDFLSEAGIFIVMMATMALPLVNGVQAIVALIRAGIS